MTNLGYVYDQVPVGESKFWFLGRSSKVEAAVEPTFGLVDEASKLNLNVVTVEMLQALPGMIEELAAAIVDWRDTDDDVTENGAESQTYLLKNLGYPAKNAPFESIEEMALLNGADPIILYGEDTNLMACSIRTKTMAIRMHPRTMPMGLSTRASWNTSRFSAGNRASAPMAPHGST